MHACVSCVLKNERKREGERGRTGGNPTANYIVVYLQVMVWGGVCVTLTVDHASCGSRQGRVGNV